MAERKPLEELRGAESLDNILFQVDLDHFGYYNVPKGSRQYLVLKEDANYAVYQADAEIKDGEVVFDLEHVKETYPIIRSIDNTVVYTSKARQDPYQDHFISINEDLEGSVEDKIIDAFGHFIEGNYQTGMKPYITYFASVPNYEEGVTIINADTEQEPVENETGDPMDETDIDHVPIEDETSEPVDGTPDEPVG